MISSLDSTSCSPSKQITVALVGNPNCGKTTLFNALTGSHQKVGNYPGVTVEKKTGRFYGPHGEVMCLIDLPGTYSLNPTSPDEFLTTKVLLGLQDDVQTIDCIMCITDATSLQRHLFLVSQVFDLGIPIILILTMMDLLKRYGKAVYIARLSKELGCPVIPCNAFTRSGLVELRHHAVKCKGLMMPSTSISAPIPPFLREAITRLSKTFPVQKAAVYRALFEPYLAHLPLYGLSADILNAVIREQSILDRKYAGWRESIPAARYRRIQGICSRVIYPDAPQKSSTTPDITDRIDHYCTHPILGWVVFILVMTSMFLAIFAVASYPMDWIQIAVSSTQSWAKGALPKGDLTDLFSDGVLAGLGGVFIFLPQILILFFFIGLLENTGYMARAAFMMEHLMNRVGLHGKSFIPLLSSFACAIPGIMSTRTIPDARERLITILIAPFMSCSARIPVYTLMITLLLPTNVPFAPLAKAGLMLSIYSLGIAAAFTCGWIFKKTILRIETACPMVMELPPYRYPSFAYILYQTYQRAMNFLRHAGTVILGISILLWFLANYPKVDTLTPQDALRHSFAGKIGLALEPIFQPLGFNWKISVGLLFAQAAREIFISTLSIAYSVEETTKEVTSPLREALLKDCWPDGRPVFTPLVCMTIMVFFALSLQCISTVAITLRETNNWRWPVFQLVYMFIIAYVTALIVYQIGRLFF